MKKLKIPGESNKLRADIFLARQYPKFARAAIARLFKADMVKINGVAEKAGYKLRDGDKMEVDDSWLVETPIEDIDLKIIYEDKDVLVVDKPSGVLSHSRGGLTREASVASFLRHHVDKSMSTDRAGIVHRLDRATSGVMICAKNESTQSYLQKQFQDRKVEKTYVAVTERCPKHPKALIDAPIGRDQNNPKQFKVEAHGKPAQTSYTVKQLKSGNYIWELNPLTGRTHQLRVHLNYLGCPIIGDELYNGKQAERLYLHAKTLKIMLPGGEKKTFQSNVPMEFLK